MELLIPATPAKAEKADFEYLYNETDPGPYFRCVAELDYRIPAYTAQLVRQLISAGRLTKPNIADLCCPYGITAALLNHDLTLPHLNRRYTDRQANIYPWAEQDREFFARHRSTQAVPVVGPDTSRRALRYATPAGLINHRIETNLESEPLSQRDAQLLNASNLICVSGGLGYIGARTIITIIGAARTPPIIAGFVLRWIDIRAVIQFLTIYGYRVALDDHRPYPQRRYADRSDRACALAGLHRLRLAPSRIELGGYHAAVPFIAVPPGAEDWHAILGASSQIPAPVL